VFDLLSNIISYGIIFESISPFDFKKIIFSIDLKFVFQAQVVWSSIFFFFNLYDTKLTLSRFDEIIKIFPVIYLITVFGITFDVFGLVDLNIEYKSLLSYSLLFSFILILARFFIHSFQKYLLKIKVGHNNAVILGLNRRGLAVFNSLKDQHFHGLRVKGFIQASDDPKSFEIDSFKSKKIGNENEINEIIKSKKIDDVIIALEKPTPERIMSSIVSINGAPSSIKILPDMYEVVTGLARTTQLVGVPLIDVNFNIDTFYSRILKRIFESLISMFAIVLCLPFWLLIAILIKISSRGPIFYRQTRSGRNGKLFEIIKFRSMVFNAELETGPVWAEKEDSRITTIGKLLRRLHLDETPQLINIVKGDMSIVGPRPERPFFVDKLKKTYPFYNRRLKIRPGVTGWAQINQPFDTNVKDVHQKLKYDFYYIENLSFRLDLHIVFRTFWVVLRGHKA
tara:strand:- start:2782 stop:4140 length:1359 start_codon:yes stop_codon:yes gene_type:complete